MTDTKRDALYDWLRLIATVFVVIGHSAYTAITATHGGVHYDISLFAPHPAYYSWPLALWRELPGWVYRFHMPLFFMLSGAVQALAAPRRPGAFLRGKARRLLAPYFLCGWLFMLPLKYLAGFYDRKGLRLAARGLPLGQDSGHLWFLPALFWCIVVYMLLDALLARLPGRGRDAALLAAAGGVSLLGRFLPFDFLALQAGLEAVFWFCLGNVFQRQRARRAPWGLAKTLAAFAALLALQAANIRWRLLDGVWDVLAGALLTLALAKLCALLLKGFTHTRAWRVLVRDLFYVYLFHDPLEYLLLRLFLPGGLLGSAWGCYAYAFCRTAGVFAVSLLLGEGLRALRRGAAKLIARRKKSPETVA